MRWTRSWQCSNCWRKSCEKLYIECVFHRPYCTQDVIHLYAVQRQ